MATREQIALQIKGVQRDLTRAYTLYDIAVTRGDQVRYVDDDPDAAYTLTPAQKQAFAATFDQLIASVKTTVAGW